MTQRFKARNQQICLDHALHPDWSHSVLALRYGLTRVRIGQILKAMKAAPTRRQVSAMIVLAARVYQDHPELSVVAAARMHGVSQSTLRQYLKTHSIPIRPSESYKTGVEKIRLMREQHKQALLLREEEARADGVGGATGSDSSV